VTEVTLKRAAQQAAIGVTVTEGNRQALVTALGVPLGVLLSAVGATCHITQGCSPR